MSAPQLTPYQTGVGVVYADQLNTFCQTCDVVDQLRSIIGLPGMQVSVRGTLAVADGGQGEFYWDSAGVGPDNGVTIIVPSAAASGVWARLSYAPFLYAFLPATADVPAATGTGGFLFVAANGALKYRGPTTITQLAPP